MTDVYRMIHSGFDWNETVAVRVARDEEDTPAVELVADGSAGPASVSLTADRWSYIVVAA